MSDKEKEFFTNVGSNASSGPSWTTPTKKRMAEQEDMRYREPNRKGGAAWASSDDMFWRVGQAVDAIPPGVYRMAVAQGIGPYFLRVKNETDTLVRFPDSESDALLQEIERFQGMKSKFKEHGFLHKRGVLMWGPPGSGKTTTLQWLIKLIVEQHGGIACFIESPTMATECLQLLRQIEPQRQVVGIMEDLDALVSAYGESAFLALLDGESQVDNVVYVATTNYPERLDRRFVDRPSRFDTIRYIGMPSPAARETYLKAKMPSADAAVVKEMVSVSEGYSVAHLRELIILTQCFEMSIQDAVARLNKARGHMPNSTKAPDRETLGFAKSKSKPGPLKAVAAAK